MSEHIVTLLNDEISRLKAENKKTMVELHEKQLEIYEVDLRCAEFEDSINELSDFIKSTRPILIESGYFKKVEYLDTLVKEVKNI